MTDQPEQRPARRVVVAEDEALIRLDVVEMLREAGFDAVEIGPTGQRALAFIRGRKPVAKRPPQT